jgi:arylsulfatase
MKKTNSQFISLLKESKYPLIASAALLSGCNNAVHHQTANDVEYKGKIGKTLKETEQWWPNRQKYHDGAPNVVWILIDDAGFGASSAFGGLIQTPILDSLANNGLRYTNFHTTAICSPTRAALITGRNSHSVHMGLFPQTAIGTPGYDGYMPFDKATAAEILRENGYNTYAVGKWHLTPAADETQLGPFDRWPTGRGFDHFFGFLNGSTDQYHPQLWEDTRKIESEYNGKLLTTRLADKAIDYITEQKSLDPKKPFFLYLTPGATHTPHHTTPEWIAKYKGKFDKGWDAYREEVLARQIKLGVVPAGTKLPPSNPGVKKWNNLKPEEQKLYARFAEVYAGFLSQTDYEIGRIVNRLKELGQLDNTLIFVSIGDNGASKEGTFVGIASTVNNPDLTEDQRLKKNIEQIDKLGSEYSMPNYPLGWAQAANTPFKYWKQDANSEGGTHNPLIVFWPKGIKDKGGIRNQYSHVIDVLPTTIDLVGAKVPESINGYKQAPIEGNSFAASINDAKSQSLHKIQHYEIMGSRAIYNDGWKAGTLHVKGRDFDKDKWELYKVDEDFNELNNLAEKNPEKLKELQKLFEDQAWKFNIFPLKDELTPSISPNNFDSIKQVVLYPGISQIIDGAGPWLTRRSFTVTANVELDAKSEGVLFSSGGRFSGISFFLKNGKLQFVYNLGNGEKYQVSSEKNIVLKGPGQLTVDLKVESNKPNAPAEVILSVNSLKVGEGHIAKTIAGRINSSEGIEIGKDPVTPVDESYKSPFAFTGKLQNVVIDLK